MNKPLVSIICLCFNQEQYIKGAIMSVLEQEYQNIELIVVDDASTDNSREIISEMAKKHGFKTVLNTSNQGNCRAFNKALALSKGKFYIDLAADDVLLPARVRKGIEAFSQLSENYGVHFCNVEEIDAEDRALGNQYTDDEITEYHTRIPTGNVYLHLLQRHFISAPSMMFRREVMEKLEGYDESLSYEDFDFWIRSSRYFLYCFSPEVLVRKRRVEGSLSSVRMKIKNRHILDTAKVCQKAQQLNQSAAEDRALAKRCVYELRWAIFVEKWEALSIFLGILDTIKFKKTAYYIGKISLAIKPPLHRYAHWMISKWMQI